MNDKVKVAIVLCCLIAAVGIYAVGAGGGSTSAAISVPKGGVLIAAGIPDYSGIENVYIVDNSHAAGWDIDFGTYSENVLGVITANEGTANIPYETGFKIVVAVKGHTDNMAYVQKENLQVELAASGAFTITQENSANDKEYVFAESAGVYIRVNVVWDNDGAGYTLPAGGSISLNPIRLWCWS